MEKLKDFRISLGLTITEFANEIEVSKFLYEKVESGDRKPSREFTTKLKSRFPQFDVNILFTSWRHKVWNKTKHKEEEMSEKGGEDSGSISKRNKRIIKATD